MALQGSWPWGRGEELLTSHQAATEAARLLHQPGTQNICTSDVTAPPGSRQ